MNHLRIFLFTLMLAAGSALPASQPGPAQNIPALMQRVNAWQIANPRMKADDRNWERGTWYTGVMAAYRATGDEKYLQQALDWGRQHQWQVGTEESGANRLFCAMTWVECYLLKKDPAMLKPTLDWLATAAPNSPAGAKVWFGHAPAPFDSPLYSDSLFAMPVFALLHKTTGDPKYLDILDHFFCAVSRRDDRQGGKPLLPRREFHRQKNSDREKNLLVARQRLGLCRHCRGYWNICPRTIRTASSSPPRCAPCPRPSRRARARDGFWRPNLADPEHVPVPESSGTGFFCYGMAWGIRNGVLDKETYLPVVKKAWTALAGAVSPTGMVQWGQQVGDRPAATRKPRHTNMSPARSCSPLVRCCCSKKRA